MFIKLIGESLNCISVNSAKIVELPKINDARGNLTFLEAMRHVPFEIKRIFYLFDVPTGESRGAHAHRELHQFLICLSGSFDVVLNDGIRRRVVHLNRPWIGLHIPPMLWASEENFDPGSVCLVITSDYFSENDYIRNFGDFLEAVKNGSDEFS